ncbi:TIGR04222 domain-containing membrane protein [Actinosynnema sp. NPDC047251]|uniref:Putative membrane protein n=1 Tax=Saccharothrix espanaensis (strain ATCC 51144 / DSM 44229 / JCM 9112 / NBRC 15066 / NRRL 15764) TaxID=1179773 RepID=K0JYB7_SACES|nr:TIGR04222 domain-containing membrane protein [Saccharothrix espanaensis]CCH29193.1 putative membrane protein [Saccharothrix espanaensis DSM 44229]
MERPWGLSGPEFLELYWIALAVAVAWAIAVRVRLRGTRGGAPAGVLGAYEIAFLTGGPRRVVETAVASLIASDALRPARDGAVSVIGKPVVHNPVDQAVIADATRYKYRTLTLMITSVSDQGAAGVVGDSLVERGYLVPPRVAKRRLGRSVVPLALLFAIGVFRWANGLVIGAPVGWLTLQLVLTGVLIWLFRKPKYVTPTALGNSAVGLARAGETTGGGGATGRSGEVWPVALRGFNAHPNIPLRAAARQRPRPRAAQAGVAGGFIGAGASCSGGSSSSCGGSSGSSCGGGGGGGGGCGGGGGGG